MISSKQRKNGFLITLVIFTLLMLVRGFSYAELPPQTAEPTKKEPHRVPMLDQKPKLDGIVDEEIWKQALMVDLKYEVSPGENIPAPVQTEVYIYTTKTHIYVGFVCHDPNPSAIVAQLSDRDKLYQDDYVGFLLDPFNDKRRRFNLFCNPLGVQADFSETITEDYIEWDIIWESAGKILSTGWNVEMAIPFSSLRFPRTKEEQTWFFDIARSYPRDVRHGLRLVPFDRNNPCYVCMGEEIVGFKGIKAGKDIELDPTLAAVYTQERENFPSGKFVKKESKVDPGLTARWSFTPNMTLGAAINPDFSNVEADAAQLDINKQFALYYDEKRPFFLEGAGVFSTRLPIVYTRSLADPDWGIKLTGKEGGNTIGFYTVQDNITNLIFPSATRSRRTSLDLKSVATVLRYRRDIGASSGIGVIITDREGKGYYNRLAGIDATLRLTKSDQVQVQFIASQSRYPEAVANNYGQSTEKIDGAACDVYYRHDSRNVYFTTYYRQVSPDFRADLGFITMAGYKQMGGSFSYIDRKNPGFWYNTIIAGPSFKYETDNNDNMISKAVKFTTQYGGPMQSSVTLIGGIAKKYYMGKIFNYNNVETSIQVIPSGKVIADFYAYVGDGIDLDNVRQGKQFTINPSVTYKIGNHITFELNHVLERLNAESKRLYTANVTNFKFLYQFNRKALLHTNFQYTNYNFNSSNYLFPIDSQYKHLFTKILFSYTINPQTVLFLGYSDDHYGDHVTPLTQSNRTFFLKIGHALMF